MISLFWHELLSRRVGILGWGLSISFLALIYIPIYPSFAEQMAGFQDLLDLPIYQALGVSSMANLADYLSSTFFNFLPILVGIYAIITGTGALAGEEDKGTLELLVTLPLSRSQIVIAKALAMLVAIILILGLALMGCWISLAIASPQIEDQVSFGQISVAVVNALPLGAFFLMAALFFGAFFPTRGIAGMAAAAVLILSYIGNNLVTLVESLENLKFLFPHNYYSATAEAFTEGLNPSDVLVLSGLALVFFLLALLAFNRRNLMTAAWFWQRQHPPAEI
jgi:ABC-2 type transport system permease protein